MTNFEQAFRYYARKAPRQWFRIQDNVGDDNAKVYLYDQIGGMSGVSANEFVQELNEIDADVIEVHINCPGGAVYDGIAIMNALRQHPAHIVSFVDGLAASAASYIAVGGADEVVMCENSELMIHDAWGACIGDSAEMQRMADDLERISNNIASVYARRSGGDVDQWRSAMLAETWYSADEAVTAGLADRVAREERDGEDEASSELTARASKNRWNLTYYQHAGRADAPDPFIPAGEGAPAYVAQVTTHNHETHVHLPGRVERPHTPPSASAVGSTPPVAPASGDTTQEGAADVFTDEQLNSLRQSLGVAADADADTILGALNEALQERAGDTPAGATPTAPEGMVLIEADQLDLMRNDAAAGRAAREQQLREAREDLVDAAVRDGRVSAARRDHWVAQLEADDGVRDTLAALPKLFGTDELGHAALNTDDVSDSAEGDATYAEVYGTNEKGA